MTYLITLHATGSAAFGFSNGSNARVFRLAKKKTIGEFAVARLRLELDHAMRRDFRNLKSEESESTRARADT